jgi:glycosyltransferase involved in cell wall biosynthesis
MTIRVTYTQAAKLGGAGIGSIAYQFIKGLYRAGLLHKAVVAYEGVHDIPPSHLASFRWMRLVARLARDNHPIRDAIFDQAAARHIPPCDIFHGWSHQCQHSLHKAKSFGAITFLERQNSHDRCQNALVQAEYDTWGYQERPAVRPHGMKRGLAEYETADYITVPSPFVYESFIAEGFAKDRLFLVPYGVDIDRFKPDPNSWRDHKTFRLLFVGQVSLRKGVPYLLQAWQKSGLAHAELWLAGRIVPDAERVIKPFLNEPTIKFLQHVPDTARLYQQVDACVLPSIEEGSALVTYEAMACGLPLIYTYHTGAVARHMSEGIEVPIRDVNALAEAISRLYEDKLLRQFLGAAGRLRAEEFSWDQAVQKLIAAYETVMPSPA